MKHGITFGLISCGIVAAVSLNAGCSGDVSKSQITKAINEKINEKSCFSVEKKGRPSWPLKVRTSSEMYGETTLSPILAAMQKSGYLQVTVEEIPKNQKDLASLLSAPKYIWVIAPTEQAKGWWDVQDGFCVGRIEVAEIKEWTEPGKDTGSPITVQYTWHLDDIPSWAKKPEFESVPGMKVPVPGTTVLQKTSNGWKVVR